MARLDRRRRGLSPQLGDTESSPLSPDWLAGVKKEIEEGQTAEGPLSFHDSTGQVLVRTGSELEWIASTRQLGGYLEPFPLSCWTWCSSCDAGRWTTRCRATPTPCGGSHARAGHDFA